MTHVVRRSILLAGCLLGPLILTLGATADGTKILSFSGPAAAAAVALSLEEIEAMGPASMTTTTPWHDVPTRFDGVLAASLVDKLAPGAKILEMTALNDYRVVVEVSDLRRYSAMIVTRVGGEPMKVRDRGPLWLLYPFDRYEEVRTPDYVARMIWQLKEIVAR